MKRKKMKRPPGNIYPKSIKFEGTMSEVKLTVKSYWSFLNCTIDNSILLFFLLLFRIRMILFKGGMNKSGCNVQNFKSNCFYLIVIVERNN